MHEIVALHAIRDLLPDSAPVRAWANFEFVTLDGALYEVDLLVVTRAGLFLVELKDWQGRISGDVGTWEITSPNGRTRLEDSPYILLNRKAKQLASLLRDHPRSPFRGAARTGGLTLPFVESLVYLTNDNLQLALSTYDRAHVVTRAFVPGSKAREIESALLLGDYPGAVQGRKGGITEEASQMVARALEAVGIQRTNKYRRVENYTLDEHLFSGPGFQDFRASHNTLKDLHRRIRRFNVAEAATEDSRDRIRRAALREFRLLSGVDHPHVVNALDYKDTELGPCLVFDHRPDAVRLDHFIKQKGERLKLTQRLDLLQQLVEAVQAMHGKGVFHRGLSPEAVLVDKARTETPHVLVFTWQTGADADGTSGTSHLDVLMTQTAQVYTAPEALSSPETAREQADVFSLGALAYFVLTNKAPAADLADLRGRLAREQGLSLAASQNGVPQPLHRLVYESTRAKLDDRLTSVDAVLALLEEARRALAEPTSAPETDPLAAAPGQALSQGFTLIRRLGGGATAVGLLVKRDDADVHSVLKVARTAQDNGRLAEEAEVLADLRHMNVVRCLGVFEMAGRTALHLDFAGESLRERLRTDGAFDAPELLDIGGDLISLVNQLLHQGHAHRDLKPENIGLSRFGTPLRWRPRVFDFSLSRARADQVRLGTAAYRDPFLETGDRRAWDQAAELYSLAMVLHEMATGDLPLWGDGRSDPAALADAHPRILTSLFPTAHAAALTTFFQRALARSLTERFDNAEEMAHAWKQALSGPAQSAATPSAPADTDAEGSTDDAAASVEQPGETEHPSLAGTTLDTPVELLGFSTRAANVLEREDIRTVGALLTVPPRRLRTLRGLGTKTRAELVARIEALRPRFADALRALRPARAPSSTEAGLAQGRLEDFLPHVATRGHAAAHRPRRFWLGLEPADRAPGHWPTAAEVAAHMQQTRAAVTTQHTKDREHWLATPALEPLFLATVELLTAQGGVATPLDLARGLLERFPTDAPPAEALRVASALARVAVDALQIAAYADDPAVEPEAPPSWLERLTAKPAVDLLRLDDRLLIGQTTAHLRWVQALGECADALVAAESIVSGPRALEALRAVPPEPGIDAPEHGQLLRLAVLAARRAALSTRQELYPRAMPAAVALRLSLGALLTEGPLTAVDVRDRVAQRYPEAAPLPDRPELDALLADAGSPLTWQAARGGYLPPDDGPSTRLPTSLVSTAGPISTQEGAPVSPPASQAPATRRAPSAPLSPDRPAGPMLSPDEAEARLFAERLEQGAEPGAYLVLVSPRGRLLDAEAALTTTTGAQPVSLEASLLDAMHTIAAEKRIPWDLVLRADAAPGDSRDGQNFRRLLNLALDRVETQLAAAAPGAVLMLTEAGLLARYDKLDLIERLRESARVGRLAARALWVLVPADDQRERPMLDGRTVPVLTPAQAVRLSSRWLELALRDASAA